MSKKRHTKEARIRAIREHEAGRSQAEICRQLNITAPTFYRWKKQLGMMTNSDAQRLRTLEKDNKELKQMVCRPPAGEARPQDRARKKTLSPRALRELLPAVLARTTCSERRACRILGLHRNTARYSARPRKAAPEVERALLAVFSRHPRLGHRKAKVLVNRLLAAQGLPAVGLRQIRRLRRLLCLSVPQEKPRRPRRGHTTGRIPTKAAYARHVWTWDFVSDITTRGGGFRTLVLIDEHTKQCVAHHVARRIGADDVMAVLSKAIEAYGAPEHIRSDNGPEFIAAPSAMAWPTAASVSAT